MTRGLGEKMKLEIADCRIEEFRDLGIERFDSAEIVQLALIPKSLNSSIP
jgi:hypothetical protein